ncbi:MAG: EAL domain-containing protein [Gallionella sp.]
MTNSPASSGTGTRFRFGIGLKLGILLAAFGVLASGLTGYYTYHATREILIKKASDDLVQSTQVLGRRFSSMVAEDAKDVLLFAGTSDTREATGSGHAAGIARQEMAEHFKSMLLEHPEYYQARLISAQNNGIELVRVDRDGNRLKIVSGQDLQEKLQYPYVYQTLRLKAGQVHYSEIFINREIGAHSGFNKPTLQIATPVAAADGKVLGVLVLNVDLNQEFTLLKSDLSKDYQLYLTNQDGDFLINPDSTKTFGFDYGRRFLVQDTFESVAAIVDKAVKTISVHTVSNGQASAAVGGFARVSFGDSSGQNFVIIGMTVPLDAVLADTNVLARNSGLIAIGFSLLAVVLSMLVALLFVRPLKRLVAAVQRFSATREPTPIHVRSKDELGLLARSIGQMQEQVLAHLNDLKRHNEDMALRARQDARIMAELKQLEAQKQEALSRLQQIASQVPGIVFQFRLRDDGSSCVPYANETIRDIYRVSPDEVRDDAAPIFAPVHPDDLPTHLASIEASAKNLTPWHHEYRLKFDSEPDIWLLGNAVPQREADGAVLWHGFITDITEHKQAEQRLRIAAAAFESQESLMITDANRVILQVNQAFIDESGYTAEEVVGQTPRMFQSGRHKAAFYSAMWKTIRDTGTWQGEIWDRRKNGEVYPKWLTITAVKDAHGAVTHYVGSHLDIRERKMAEEKIQRLAFYDPLTQLPNRRLLMDRLQHALASSERSGRSGAMLFLDLDHFKSLNDTLGHDIGDLLLQQVAQRLTSCVRDDDTVARLGGDEFVVILEVLNEDAQDAAAQTEAIGEKIQAALNQPYQLAAHQYRSTPSIGVTLFHGNQTSLEELMKQSDIAMYQAKQAGRNKIRFFDPKMQASVDAHAALEHDLRGAVEQQQFQLHYQIQVDSMNRPLGAEALIRWNHPLRGMVSPAQFIPLAEETGLILYIGEWVLETACTQLKAWERDAFTRALVLAVNVSAKQFHQAGFVEQVLATIRHHAINPERLKLELTEGILVENIEETIATMNTLNKIGVRFSLDDFGTGYSSLQYLKRLPLSQIKIDQSFVRDITTDTNDAAIVQTIIAMADTLGLNVVAEGVETKAQREFLELRGCTHYQGYLFGKPVSIEQFEALLKQK